MGKEAWHLDKPGAQGLRKSHDNEWYLWKQDKSMKQEPQTPVIKKSQKISQLVLFSRNCNTVMIRSCFLLINFFFRTVFLEKRRYIVLMWQHCCLE